MSVDCMHAVPLEARRGFQIPSYRQLLSTMWDWDLNSGPVEEQPVFFH
jgi:hypothetical protein